MRFELINDSCVKQKVDVIVNVANEEIHLDGLVDKEIMSGCDVDP